jgi:tRNA A37 threonylcarbamoyladenosine modification protein TsaB
MLSIFVNGYKYFIATKKYRKEVLGAENVISAIEKVITNEENEIIFSSGPDTFTSMRVIGSIIKGISLCAPQVTFLAISNFLTLFSLVPNDIDFGIIAIDTMRGDFYCMDFTGMLLTNYRLIKKEELCSNNNFIIYNKNVNNVNLAKIQINMLNSEKFNINQHLIAKSLKINYGTTPQYKY